MYLSDREMAYAIRCGRLIVEPPTKIGPTSIDLHLDKVEQARVWNMDEYRKHNEAHGHPPTEIRISSYHYGTMSRLYHMPVPPDGQDRKVFRRDRQIVVRPMGFVLWQTKEVVGTPKDEADLILFIDGKSTRTARTGVLVHFCAPTIHAGWAGQVTLEIGNLGPFDIVLQEDDVIAQITVATVSSIPKISMERAGSTTLGQRSVGGAQVDQPR
jgi:dCTP deaminase